MKLIDLRTKSVDELKSIVTEAKNELVEKHKSLRSGELQNPRTITELKKRIARANTLLAEKQNNVKEGDA